MKNDADIPTEPLLPPAIGHAGYQGLNPRIEILRQGDRPFSARALSCDILVEHDVAIQMRDGVKLYADIYRPTATHDRVPAILSWSPFGKKFNGIQCLRLITPWNLGIPPDALSGLEKFEGLDPAEWVDKGYAIANVDSRGAFDSEGRMVIMGTQEAEDGFDTIEDLASREWCNGMIGMAGNSHLAIVQWFIAALQPPSLKAIAPWEGCGDLYREQFARGGIYGGDMFDQLIVKHMLRGHSGMESFRHAYETSPLMNSWWADKRPQMSNINIPTYITGTWTNSMHGMGAIRGWMEITKTDDKWLRFHPYQEWHDLWANKQAQEELLRFFDRYLKLQQNGWESTPRLRLAVLRYETAPPLVNVVHDDFPIPQTIYRKAYLRHGGLLSLDELVPSQGVVGEVSYDSQDRSDFVSFTYLFPQTTQLVGIAKAVLYMSCPATDDLDIHIILCKISSDGKEQRSLNIPWDNIPVSSIDEIPDENQSELILYKGPAGVLRASHREVDVSKSLHENWPFHPHRKEQKIPPGQVTRLEIGIWAMGVEYAAGESIQLQISGHYRGMTDFKGQESSVNKGKHVVHFGGGYDSHLVLPFLT
ncbi:hypothetical protein AtubIFM57258_002369 [Aspergillus tubingensis]|nr:hypothetical protein AtubIFM57258_002369 [Aspergillus tubingensis]